VPIVVYSTPHCQRCRATMRKLDQLHIPYQVVDVADNPQARDRLASLGFREAPVVDTGTEVFNGYRPDRLEALAR
jgi:glutaredoxin-like protein NrdH